MDLNIVHNEDCLSGLKKLPNNSVDCCITSPPYYSLRDYQVDGQVGQESTVQEYVSKLTEIFEEVRRVLKPTGVFYLNIGDTYSNFKSCKSVPQTISKFGNRAAANSLDLDKSHNRNVKSLKLQGFKNKELMNVPHRLVFALSDVGWYHRQTIIWAKATSGETREGSAMPESVTDRFSSSFEYVFMLTKNDKYFFDQFSVKEPLSTDTFFRSRRNFNTNKIGKENGNFDNRSHDYVESGLGNMRNVWRINLQPGSSGQHIAGYPERLVEVCLKTGSSEYGCCAECGDPYIRILKKDGEINMSWSPGSRDYHKLTKSKGRLGSTSSFLTDAVSNHVHSHWEKTCKCDTNNLKKSVILDPFMGSGTTALVALKNSRDFIGYELNPEYVNICNNRIAGLINTVNYF